MTMTWPLKNDYDMEAANNPSHHQPTSSLVPLPLMLSIITVPGKTHPIANGGGFQAFIRGRDPNHCRGNAAGDVTCGVPSGLHAKPSSLGVVRDMDRR